MLHKYNNGIQYITEDIFVLHYNFGYKCKHECFKYITICSCPTQSVVDPLSFGLSTGIKHTIPTSLLDIFCSVGILYMVVAIITGYCNV